MSFFFDYEWLNHLNLQKKKINNNNARKDEYYLKLLFLNKKKIKMNDHSNYYPVEMHLLEFVMSIINCISC
jgi:hypothetical protein